jgi:glucose-6-phosphate 1-epimerase
MTEFGALPALSIQAADGASATVTLFGAQLVSWRTGDGRERLFCSTHSARDGSAAIRGGVPVIFPQFAGRGAGLRHGFARVCHWRLAGCGEDDGDHYAELSLTPADLPAQLAAAWPHAFALRLRVTLRTDGLDLSLSVDNTGAQPFEFAAALHAYYLVEALETASVEGLCRVQYEDEAKSRAVQEQEPLRFCGKLDRVYHPAPPRLTLRTASAALRLDQDGFTDAVVWNPGAFDAAVLSDLADDEFQSFVCIEPALLGPRQLAAGAAWRGVQRINVIGNG